MNLRYQAPSEISKMEFLDIIADNVIVLMCQAIVDAVHNISDYDWLLFQLKNLLIHPDEQIRGVTVTCIGHLARLNPKADRKELLSILRPMLSDSPIIGQVEDAIDDVCTFT